jgi:hypothetical protein
MLITTNLFKNKKFQAKLKALKFEKDENTFRRDWDYGDSFDGIGGSITIELTEYNRVDFVIVTPQVDEWHANDKKSEELLDLMRASANITNEMRAVVEAITSLVDAVKLADETTRNDFVSVKLERDYYNSDGTCIVYGINSGGDKTEVGRIKINDFMTQKQIEDKVQECLKKYREKK